MLKRFNDFIQSVNHEEVLRDLRDDPEISRFPPPITESTREPRAQVTASRFYGSLPGRETQNIPTCEDPMSVDELGFLSPEIELYRQRIRQRYAEFFNLIQRACRCCHAAKEKFQIHNRDGQELFAVPGSFSRSQGMSKRLRCYLNEA